MLNAVFETAHLSPEEIRFKSSLTTRGMDVLETLEERPGYVLSKREIMDGACFPLSWDESYVDNSIRRINEKAARSGLGYTPIEGYTGHGYMAITIPQPEPKNNEKIHITKDLYIDKRNYSLSLGKNRVKLSKGEYYIAVSLFENPHRVLTEDKLIEHFKTANRSPTHSAVESEIKRFRKTLVKCDLPKNLVATVYGIGWYADPGKLKAA